LGDVLSSIINDETKEKNGHNKSITDTHTESSPQ
jgi:hypothetical protein